MSFTVIGIRNLPRRKLRNALTIVGIILGVALLVGVNIAFDSALAQFTQVMNQSVGNVDITVRSALVASFDKDKILSAVRAVDGVDSASARIIGGSRVQLKNGTWVFSSLTGVDSNFDFEYLDKNAINITGKYLLERGGDDIVVDENLNYTIGEIVKVKAVNPDTDVESGTREFRVVGIYHPSPMAREFAQGAGYRIYIDLRRLQSIFGWGNKINSIIIKVTDISQTAQVVTRLRNKLGSSYVVTAVKQGILDRMSQATSGFRFGLQMLSAVSLFVAVIIVLDTIYMNVKERTYEIGVLRAIGASRKQIFWMFFSESLLFGIIGVMIGLLVATALAKFFLYIVPQMIHIPLTFELFVVTPYSVSVGVLAGFGTAILGGMFPSIKAAWMDVLRALRPSIRGGGKPRTTLKLFTIGFFLTLIAIYLRSTLSYFTPLSTMFLIINVGSLPILLAGLILVTAGLLRVGEPVIEYTLKPFFRRTNLIVSRNVGRNLVRSTLCFALIGVSLTFIVAIAGMEGGVVIGVRNVVRSFFGSDVIVATGLEDKAFAGDLQAIGEGAIIEYASPALIVPRSTVIVNNATSSNSTVMIFTIDPDTFSKVISIEFSPNTPGNVYDRLKLNGTIILTSPLAETLKTEVWDSISIYAMPKKTQITSEWRNFTVIGIATGTQLQNMRIGGHSLAEACYISYETLNQSFPAYKNKANFFFIKVKPEYSNKLGYVKEHIKNYAQERKIDVFVITIDDIMEQVKQGIHNVFVIFYMILLFAVTVAAIGMATVMIMNVTERRRELGVLRAEGMSRAQVVASIIGESIVLGIAGFVMGVIGGITLFIGIVGSMRATGFPMPLGLPPGMLENMGYLFLLSMAVSIISAAYPALQTSRLNIVEAIRYRG